MRKLRLDPDALHVERFDVMPGHDAHRGTVLARETGGCVTVIEYTCERTQGCPLTLESIAVNCPTMYCESDPDRTRWCPEEDDTGPN